MGEQLSSAHPVAYIVQDRAEIRVPLPLHQQLKRLNDGQTGVDQRQELLIEDQKLLGLDLAAARQPSLSRSPRIPRALTE